MLISRKGKCFHVFGCISKNFPENIFWCLEKKKENTNLEKHKPQPRKKSSTTTNPVRRDLAKAISQSTVRSLSSRDRDRRHDLAKRRSRSRIAVVGLELTKSARTGARSLPTIVGLIGMFLLLSRACARSLSLSLSYSGNTLKGQ